MKNTPQTTVAGYRGNPAQALLEPQNQHSERVQEAVREIIDNTCNPIRMFDRIAVEVLPKFRGNQKEKAAANKELDAKANEALMALGVAYHYPVMVAVRSKYRALALNMAQEIERDYNCQTTLEKAMAENIAIAHVTIIDTEGKY